MAFETYFWYTKQNIVSVVVTTGKIIMLISPHESFYKVCSLFGLLFHKKENFSQLAWENFVLDISNENKKTELLK